jgi:plasmid stabilization system protein ParE
VSKPVLQRPRAEEDIDGIVAHFRRVSPRLAVAFLDSIEASYEMLSQKPDVGSTDHALFCPELPYPLRYYPIEEFPEILIYYIDRPEAAAVVRVLDTQQGLEALVEDLD